MTSSPSVYENLDLVPFYQSLVDEESLVLLGVACDSQKLQLAVRGLGILGVTGVRFAAARKVLQSLAGGWC